MGRNGKVVLEWREEDGKRRLVRTAARQYYVEKWNAEKGWFEEHCRAYRPDLR